MELKKYQKNVIQDLSRYLELLLEKQSAGAAYTALRNEKNVMVGLNGMPHGLWRFRRKTIVRGALE